jgi:hypothetical protein
MGIIVLWDIASGSIPAMPHGGALLVLSLPVVLPIGLLLVLAAVGMARGSKWKWWAQLAPVLYAVIGYPIVMAIFMQ